MSIESNGTAFLISEVAFCQSPFPISTFQPYQPFNLPLPFTDTP